VPFACALQRIQQNVLISRKHKVPVNTSELPGPAEYERKSVLGIPGNNHRIDSTVISKNEPVYTFGRAGMNKNARQPFISKQHVEPDPISPGNPLAVAITHTLCIRYAYTRHPSTPHGRRQYFVIFLSISQQLRRFQRNLRNSSLFDMKLIVTYPTKSHSWSLK
jgi:hypothetical protein